MTSHKDLMDMICTEALEQNTMNQPNPCPYCGQWSQNCTCEKVCATCEKLHERILEMQNHERQTHETLGAILGTDDSLEACAKLRLQERDDAYADRDALMVELAGLKKDRDALREDLDSLLRRFTGYTTKIEPT